MREEIALLFLKVISADGWAYGQAGINGTLSQLPEHMVRALLAASDQAIGRIVAEYIDLRREHRK